MAALHEAFQVEDNWQAERLLIMTPYFTPSFCGDLVKALRPQSVLLIVDDGASNSAVDDMVRTIERKRPKPDVQVLRSAAGALVHAKLIHIQFGSVSERGPKKRRIVFGSANASEPGYNPDKNAEIIAWHDYRPSDAEAINGYVEELWAASEAAGAKVDATEGWLGGIWMNFPSVRLRPHQKGAQPSAFNAWLQRGLLIAKHDPMASFLRFRLRFEQPLPDAITSLGSELELDAQSAVTFPILPLNGSGRMRDADSSEDDDENQEFRRKAHTVWTVYGDWISEDAYAQLKGKIRRKGAKERESRLKRFKAFLEDPEERKNREQALRDSIQTLNERIDPSLAERILKWEGQDVDIGHYMRLFLQKVDSDALLMEASDFSDRYIDGYEVTGVPRIDTASREWEAFVRSWCETVAFEAGRPNSRSLVARVLRYSEDEKLRSALETGHLNAEIMATAYSNKQTSEQLATYHTFNQIHSAE